VRSIRAKLLMAVLSTLIAVFLISTLAQLSQVGSNVREQIEQYGTTLVTERAQRLTLWLASKRQEAQYLSVHPQLVSPDISDVQSRINFLNQQHKDHLSGYDNLFFIDNQMNGYVGGQIVRFSRQTYSAYSTLEDAIDSRQQRISSPFRSELSNHFVILIATPIFSMDGQLLGLLAATLSMQDFGAMLLDLVKPETNETAFIVDNQGTVVAHPDPAIIGRENIHTTQVIPGITEQAETIMQQAFGNVTYQGDDGSQYAYYRRILETDGWVLIYTASARAFNRPLIQTRTWLIFSNLLAVALVGAVIYLSAEAITRPLRQMVSVMGDIATGDLTQKVQVVSDDEVGQTARYANLMADGLANIIRELKGLANTIVTSGQQIAASIEESTSGLEQSSNLATEIGSNMQLNAASIDQTKNSAQYVANSAQIVSQLTGEAAEECATAVHKATTGGEAVAEVVDAMAEISSSSEQVNQLVENLIDSAQRIEDMLELITQISEQTNLLSLNAAIEAARAGEMGQGFAVVASEVRKLATRSTHAVEEIAQLVEDIRRKVDSTSHAVQHSNNIIHQAEDRSRLTMATIDSMVASINSVEQKIRQVAEAAAEQAVNSNSIREAVANIAAATQETSAGSQELGATLEEQVAILADIEDTVAELTQLVQRLDQMMQRFKLEE
jgi:methyl-accepting chemotaxis protein